MKSRKSVSMSTLDYIRQTCCIYSCQILLRVHEELLGTFKFKACAKEAITTRTFQALFHMCKVFLPEKALLGFAYIVIIIQF
jgi:hypothetical protein